MAIRTVIYIPDPRLREISQPIETFDDELQILIDDMIETMYADRGAGLAAPQVGVNLRLAVVDCSSDKSQVFVLINPEIIESSDLMEFQEGCLSVPGVYAKVMRPNKVTLRAQNRQGEFYEMKAEGLLAECFHHEIDHLNGKVFIDYLSPIKRQLARKKVERFIREKNKRL
jgi:peptide deformylase